MGRSSWKGRAEMVVPQEDYAGVMFDHVSVVHIYANPQRRSSVPLARV